jgi:hypothetical protein
MEAEGSQASSEAGAAALRLSLLCDSLLMVRTHALSSMHLRVLDCYWNGLYM